jgi:hypothetical protein
MFTRMQAEIIQLFVDQFRFKLISVQFNLDLHANDKLSTEMLCNPHSNDRLIDIIAFHRRRFSIVELVEA